MNATPVQHVPVMLEEVLRLARPEQPGALLWDLTLGLGGHARAFLERGAPHARLRGLDADPSAVARTGERLAAFADRIELVHAPLREVGRVADERGWPAPSAVLMDLGVSSPQIDEAGRGFSYRQEGPLDMRFDPTRGSTAAELLCALPSRELATRIEELGDEPMAGEIVRLIKRNLPVETTTRLAELVLEAYGDQPSRTHPARRTFQALRILVNDELGAIADGLEGALARLGPGGRLITLTYHSGEDRVVKGVLRQAVRAGRVHDLTRRPLRPRDAEAFQNQRARSAKLRAVERVGPGF